MEWKIVTDNPQVTRKLKEFAKCDARATPALDLGDDSNVTCVPVAVVE